MQCAYCEKEIKGRWKFCNNECIMNFNKRAESERKALKAQSEALDLAFDNMAKKVQLIIEKEKYSSIVDLSDIVVK